MMENKVVGIDEIKENKDNPRVIKNAKFKLLVQSLKEFPEMMNLRPIVVNEDMVIIGGNMRYRAAKAAGWTEVPIVKATLTPEQQREFIIKDNVSGGEWDWEALAESWDKEQLEGWGLDIKEIKSEVVGEVEFTEELLEEHNYVVLYFDNEIDWLNLQSLYPLSTVKSPDEKVGYSRRGVGRVVRGVDFLKKIKGEV